MVFDIGRCLMLAFGGGFPAFEIRSGYDIEVFFFRSSAVIALAKGRGSGIFCACAAAAQNRDRSNRNFLMRQIYGNMNMVGM